MSYLYTGDSASELSDEDILLRVQTQPWLFGVLLDRYQDAFMRKTLSILHNKLDAEEVVQDAFTKIYLNAHRFQEQEGAKFSSWAYRILLNTAFTRYQKLVKHGQRFSNLDPDFESFVSEKKDRGALLNKSDAVERVLDKLPKHFAVVLRLHYLERWSQEDIAEETGENVGTIKARVHRAKAAFRKEAGDLDDLLSDV